MPVFIVSGLRVVHLMVSSPGGFSQTFGPRLAFLDFTTLGYFLAAYLLALWHRREVQLHARFMASTAVLVLPPALARALLFFVPGFGSFPLAVHGGYVLSELVTLLLLRDDQRRGGVRRPYVMLMGTAAGAARRLCVAASCAGVARVHDLVRRPVAVQARALAILPRATVGRGTLNGNQRRTSSSSPMPCMKL